MNKEEFLKDYCPDRHGTSCYKWDILEEKYGSADLISMWVADMDFKSPKEVVEALHKMVEFGVFGYTFPKDSFYQSFINWEKRRHNWEVEKDWIRFAPGVVSGIFWGVSILTEKDDAVIINMPVYYPFHNAIKNLGRKLISSELVNTNGIYTIDFEDFEKKIVENNVKLYILCSPHNPVGRVWKEEELTRLFEICEKHNVKIISDEIHHDIIIGENAHAPSASVANGKFSESIITLTSASKTFNLAGMKNSFVIIENEEIRKKFDSFVESINDDTGNMLGYCAIEAAYNNGEEWLETVLDIIKDNYKYIVEKLEKELPKVKVTPLEGTYLAWLDLSEHLGKVGEAEMKEFIETKARLAVDYGEWFGDGGRGFIRLNLATKPEFVEKAINGIIFALNNQ